MAMSSGQRDVFSVLGTWGNRDNPAAKKQQHFLCARGCPCPLHQLQALSCDQGPQRHWPTGSGTKPLEMATAKNIPALWADFGQSLV